MNAFLLAAVRSVIRADSDPARQVLFATLMKSRLSVRLAYGLHERLAGTWASAVLISGYALTVLFSIAPPANRRARVLALAMHANAQRQVARVASWVGPADCDSIRTGAAALGPASATEAFGVLGSWRRLLGVMRIVRALDHRFGFLVSCRAVAAIVWYARTKAMLETCRPGVIVVSSDSNPEEVAFACAARALAIPQVFISHAYPTRLSPPLDFSLSILEGEAAIGARRRKGPIKGDVLLAGVEGESAVLDPRRFEREQPIIGIFTSKAISWPAMAAIVDDCRRHFRARRVVIRWHPSMLERPHLRRFVSDLSGIVESPGSAPLAEVARQCDWVIADENSNVHLPVLKLGIPTVAVRGLCAYPDSCADQYGFVANGVIPPAVRSVRDVQIESLVRFFSDRWCTRFRQYDASYLHPRAALDAKAGRAIRELFDETHVGVAAG